MAVFESLILYDVVGSRPAAGVPGRVFFASDTGVGYRDNGSSWDTAISVALSNPMSAVGDLIRGGASGAPTRLAGPTSATKQFLTSTGTGSVATAPVWAGIVAGDLPATAVNSVVNDTNVTGSISAQALTLGWTGTLAISRGGTGQATASAAFDALSPMTTLGDLIYGGASGTGTRLAGNTTSTKKFLRQTGTGSVSAAPAWDTLVAGDLPSTAVNSVVNDTNVTGSITTQALTLGWTGTLAVSRGGTGQSAYTDGELLIGNTATGLLTKATLTAGTNITITNGNGSITIASTGGGTDATKLPLAGGTMSGDIITGDATGTIGLRANAIGDSYAIKVRGTNSAVLFMDNSSNTFGRFLQDGTGTAYFTFGRIKLGASSTGMGSDGASVYLAADMAVNSATRLYPDVANTDYYFATRGTTDGGSNIRFRSTTGNDHMVIASGVTGGVGYVLVAGATLDTAYRLNVSGDVKATTFVGALTGNVTGNASGTAANVTGTVAVANGGTGQTTYTNGQLLIGNTTGNTLAKATLTAGALAGVTITNGTGSITLDTVQDIRTTATPQFTRLGIGIAADGTFPLLVENDALATTTATAIALQNATASTSGAAQQYSPSLRFIGHAWNTTAVAADNKMEARVYLAVTSATTPTSTLTFGFQRASGGFTDPMTLTSAGVLSVTNTTVTAMTAGSVLFAGTGGAITQDNSNLFWDDTNNRLGIGTAAPNGALAVGGPGTVLGSTYAPFVVAGTNQGLQVEIYSAAAGTNTGWFSRRARGTVGSPTTVVSGDRLWFFGADGHDGTGFTGISSVAIFGVVDGTVSTGIIPGRLEFYTQNSSGSAILRLNINSGGGWVLFDGTTIDTGTTTGLIIGSATNRKVGLWGKTPIVQPTTAIAASTFVANTSAIANDTATWDSYTMGQVVKALRNFGVLA